MLRGVDRLKFFKLLIKIKVFYTLILLNGIFQNLEKHFVLLIRGCLDAWGIKNIKEKLLSKILILRKKVTKKRIDQKGDKKIQHLTRITAILINYD